MNIFRFLSSQQLHAFFRICSFVIEFNFLCLMAYQPALKLIMVFAFQKTNVRLWWGGR